MRKFILPAALLALAFTAIPQAHAGDTSNWYVNAGVGSNHFKLSQSGASYSKTTTGGLFNVGWRKGMFGVEAGYTDLGSITQDFGYGASGKISAHGETLGLNLHYDVNDQFYVGARTGAFFWTAKATLSAPGYPSQHQSESSTGWYAGVGGGYNFTKAWSVGVGYNYYKMSKSGFSVDNDMFDASVEYRF